MAAPDLSWVVNPDVVSKAILALMKVTGAAFAFMVSSLVGVLLYIWNEHKKAMAKMSEEVKSEIREVSADFKGEVSRVAGSLEKISTTLFDRQRAVEIRMGEQETRCEERHLPRRKNDD